MRHLLQVAKYSRWAQTERLYRAAMDRRTSERSAFLAEACLGDEALRAEVEALFEPDDIVDRPVPVAVRYRFRAVALVLLAAALMLFLVAAIAVVRFGDRTVQFEFDTTSAGGARTIEVVKPHLARALGPSAGVVRFDGDARIDRLDPVYFQRFVSLDAPHALTIVTRGVEHEVMLRPSIGTSREQWLLCLSLLSAAMASFIIAALIAIYRPELAVSRLAFAAGITLGLFLVSQTRGYIMPWMAEPWRSLMLLVFPINPLHLAICFDFFARFPPGVRITPLAHSVRVGLYAVGFLLAIPGSLLNAVLVPFGRDAYVAARHQLLPVDRWLYGVELLIFPVAGLAMLAVAARNYQSLKSPDDRRRLAWVIWGTVVGLVPFLAIELVRVAATLLDARVNLTPWIIPGNLATAAIPISFGYAIIKHQVFDIRFVVRRGVQYLLAINALRVLVLLPIAALVYGVIANRNQPIGRLLLTNSIYVYAIGALFLSLRFRTQLTRWVDRRFFREAYDRERILLELIEGIDKLESASDVSRLVSHDLESAFHPRCLFIWYRDGEAPQLKLSYSTGGYIHRHEILPESPLATLVARAGTSVELPAGAGGELPRADREWLAAAGVRLMVPMVGSDQHLFGVLMLGDKKSEEPYSTDDITLLLAMSRQIAAARENVRLKERVERDRRIRHDVLTRLPSGGDHLLRECSICGSCYDGSVTHCATDGTALELSLPVDRTIDGKYRLDRLIGKGGMGAVYEAADLRLARKVAVKIMLGAGFGDRQALRRFEREAQASARLDHPNIVTVFDFGRAGGDGAFLVMELVRGRTMRAEMDERGRLDGATAADWFEPICAAVASAHAHHVVHRDLKPENILIVPAAAGRLVKVLDFGLAKMSSTDSSGPHSLTQPGTVMGTPGYMAPEQLTGGEVDERADIFAIGVMAAEAITGEAPFRGRTHNEMLMAILNRPLTLGGEGPAWRQLELVLQRAVAKEAAARFASVADLARALIPALRAQRP